MLVLRYAWSDPLHAVVGPATYGALPNTDNLQLLWFLRWTPYAVSQAQDPLLTTHLNAPAGANLMWNSLMPLPGLLVSPVTLLFGPATGLTVVTTAALTFCGVSATACARRFVTRSAVAVVAGVLFEVAPFALAHSQGHAHIVLGVVMVPVTLLLVMDVASSRRSPLVGGLLLGGAAAATYYTAPEALLVALLCGALGVAALAVARRDVLRASAAPVARAVAIAAAVALLLMAPGLVVQLAGPQRLVGAVRPPDVAVTDLQNLVTPTQVEALAPAPAVAASQTWSGNSFEWNGYIGLPLLVLIGATLVLLRRRVAVRWLGLVLLVVVLLSFGPRLHVGGAETLIRLPWAVLDRVPLLQDILAGRLGGPAFLAAVLLFAIAVDELVSRRRLIVAAAAVGVVVASLAPAPEAAVTPPIPPYFTSGGVNEIPAGSVALVAPYASPFSANAMVWQAASGMRFRMPEGYVLLPKPGGSGLDEYPPATATSTALMTIESGGEPPSDPAALAAMHADLRRWNVRTVLVGPMAHANRVVALFTLLLQQPPRVEQGVAVWTGVTG